MPDPRGKWTEHLRPRLVLLRLNPAREAEIIEELSQHLDQRYEELRAGGAGDADARRLATAAAVLTLALGIGASSAIFALVDATLLRPLPFPHADRLVMAPGWRSCWRWSDCSASSRTRSNSACVILACGERLAPPRATCFPSSPGAPFE